jgi:hypothetical protein
MELMTIVLAVILFISLCTNAYMAFKLKSSKKTPTPTYTAEELIHDLTNGPAVVKIERINPGNIFIRRS